MGRGILGGRGLHPIIIGKEAPKEGTQKTLLFGLQWGTSKKRATRRETKRGGEQETGNTGRKHHCHYGKDGGPSLPKGGHPLTPTTGTPINSNGWIDEGGSAATK